MTRKQILHNIQERLSAILTRAQDIQARNPKDPHTYTDTQGKHYIECPGSYNPCLSETMAHDMSLLHQMFQEQYKDLEPIGNWPGLFLKQHHKLMCMFDSEKTGRPLPEWDEKENCLLIMQITAIMSLYETTKDTTLKDFIERCPLWIQRLSYMNDHAFVIKDRRDIKNTVSDSKMLEKNKQDVLEHICRLRSSLTLLLLQTPIATDDHEFLRNHIKLFSQICAKLSGI